MSHQPLIEESFFSFFQKEVNTLNFIFFFKKAHLSEKGERIVIKKKNCLKKSTWLVRNKLPVNPPVRVVPSFFLFLSLCVLSRVARVEPFSADAWVWFGLVSKKDGFLKNLFFFVSKKTIRAKPRERERTLRTRRSGKKRSSDSCAFFFARMCREKRSRACVCAF